MKKVVYIFPVLHKFRAPFHEKLKSILGEKDIAYEVIYSDGDAAIKLRKDTEDLSWGTKVPESSFSFAGIKLIYQHALKCARDADLIIVQQENKLLVNYLLQLKYIFGGPKVAFFGHGKNFQSDVQNGFRERFKRFWATKVHWWFAYNDLSAKLVESYGFPPDRITAFNNAIDTRAIKQDLDDITDNEIEELRQSLGISSDQVGIFIGGMYAEKRLDFLIEAAKLIRQSVVDFHLLLIGAGRDSNIAETAASKYDFIHYLGPKFGREKSAYAKMAKVFLMPGLVGLAVIDSFTFGLPMVTTTVPYHSPEIDYLKNDINGIIVEDSENLREYSEAVIKLLEDNIFYAKLKSAALEDSRHYTIENMAQRFSDGIVKALS